uniref:CSON001595 protein n=1 Tax=Culicoides sonorensis TaxID=179676 RepID=A0A336MI95_CULSO
MYVKILIIANNSRPDICGDVLLFCSKGGGMTKVNLDISEMFKCPFGLALQRYYYDSELNFCSTFDFNNNKNYIFELQIVLVQQYKKNLT